MYCSLSTFYDELGLTPNGMSDTVGFNNETLLEVDFSTCLAEDGRPAIAVDFVHQPIAFYNNLY